VAAVNPGPTPKEVDGDKERKGDVEAEDVEVRVRVAVSRVINISLVEQAFTVEAQMEASWVDNHLVAAVTAANLKASDGRLKGARDLTVDYANTDQAAGVLRFTELGSSSFFAPRLKFKNCIELLKDEMWFELFHAAANTVVVCMRWKYVGIFQEILELQMFPLDVQKLTMELQCSWEKAKYNVVLVKNQSSRYRSLVNTRSFVQQSEYMLSDRLKFESASSLPEESSSNKVRPARRKPSGTFACMPAAFPPVHAAHPHTTAAWRSPRGRNGEDSATSSEADLARALPRPPVPVDLVYSSFLVARRSTRCSICRCGSSGRSRTGF
jgi:hypothetical protein